MPERLTFDYGTASELDLFDQEDIGVTAHDYPAPQPEIQWASSVDTEGALPASRRHQNRTISMTVEVSGDGMLSTLQAKVAKIYAEGGTLRWEREDGSTFWFDLLAYDSYQPKFDLTHHVGGVTVVDMQFTGKPYALGEEVIGTVHVGGTSAGYAVFVEDIPGDVPAIGRLVLTEGQGQNQKSFIWGLESRYMNPSSTAALFYEAEDCFLIGAHGSVDSTLSNASGGSTVKDGSLSTSSWRTSLYVSDGNASAGGIYAEHRGGFRVFARVQVPNTNAGTVSVRLLWRTGVSGQFQIANGVVAIDPTYEATWRIVDLGRVNLPGSPESALPSAVWSGELQAISSVANDDIYWDCLWLIPFAEGSGQARSVVNSFGSPTASLPSRRQAAVTAGGAFLTFDFSGDDWQRQPAYVGDYLRIPPSGTDGRSTRFIVKASRGEVFTDADPGLDAISAQLFYTPRYLVVPDPA